MPLLLFHRLLPEVQKEIPIFDNRSLIWHAFAVETNILNGFKEVAGQMNVDISRAEFDLAVQMAAERRASTPHAVSAIYDDGRGVVIVGLSTGATLEFEPARILGMAAPSPADFSEIEISPSGYGLHFSHCDGDISIIPLLPPCCVGNMG